MKKFKKAAESFILEKDGGMSNKRIAFFLLFLNVITSAAVSIYIPCLRLMAIDLGTTDAVIQMTIVAHLIGEFFGRALCGPFIDAYGSRATILPSLTISVLGHFGCMISGSSSMFMVMRFIQAVGSSVVYVVSQNVINETFEEKEKGGVLGILELYQPIAWILFPFIGSFLAEISHWRLSFLVLLIAQLAGIVFFWAYPVKAHKKVKKAFSASKLFRDYKRVLKNFSFMTHALIPGLFAGGYMIFATSAPFICSKFFGDNSANVALFAAIPLFFYVAATFIYRAVVRRCRLAVSRRVGTCVYGVFSAYLIYLTASQSAWTPGTLLTLMCLQCSGSAFLVPMSVFKALRAASRSSANVGASAVVMFRSVIMSVCIATGAKFSGGIATIMSCVFMTVATVLLLIATRKIIKTRVKRRRVAEEIRSTLSE